MDSIHLTANRRTLEGLRLMMFDTIGDNEYVHASVELPIALYIVEVAKRNVDTEHYFPFGKVKYANRTQAERKAAQLGIQWECYKGIGRPFYVALKLYAHLLGPVPVVWQEDTHVEVPRG